MRKVGIFTILFLLWGMSLSLSAQSGRMKLLKSSHYFGWVEEKGGKVGYNFRFVNTGKAPLKITNVRSSCGCTAPNYPEKAIQPGDTSGILVVFDPENRPGSFRKQIYYSTDGSPSKGTLTISGRVRPRPKGPRDYYPFVEGNLRMKTNHLTFGKLYHTKTKELTNVFYNRGEKPIHIDLQKSDIPPFLEVRMSKQILEPGDTVRLNVKYIAEKREDWGFLFDNLYLISDDHEKPIKAISVSAHIKESFPKNSSGSASLYLNKTSIEFGKVKQGALPTLALKLKNTGRSELLVRRVYSKCSCLEFKIEEGPILPGESRDLEITFNTRGRIGQIQKEFFLITNSAKAPERRLLTKITVEQE